VQPPDPTHRTEQRHRAGVLTTEAERHGNGLRTGDLPHGMLDSFRARAFAPAREDTVAAKKNTASKPTTKPAKTFGSKTRFVLGLPPTHSAKQVVEAAKRSGIAIAEGQVHSIRWLAKSKAGKTSAQGRRPQERRGTSTTEPSNTRDTDHETLLLEAAMHVGLAKARELLDRVRAHVKTGF
jgi:hypothetical protein